MDRRIDDVRPQQGLEWDAQTAAMDRAGELPLERRVAERRKEPHAMVIVMAETIAKHESDLDAYERLCQKKDVELAALKEQLAGARNAALEEAAEACENLVESIGDRSAYDDREMYDTELERMHTATDCAAAIRTLASQSAAPVQPKPLYTPPPRQDLSRNNHVGAGLRLAESIAAEQIAAPPVQQPDDALAAHLEAIAANWDGDMVDSVGESINVGDALRSQFKRLCQALATTRPSAALTDVEIYHLWKDRGGDGAPGALRFARAVLAASGGAEQKPWHALNDVQWMNIVNHDHAYHSFSKDDAVHEAVKRTEAKLRELNSAAPATPSQQGEGSGK